MVRGSKTGPSLITGPPLQGTASRSFPKTGIQKFWRELESRGGIAGQARVAAEGLEMEVDRSSRVVAAEQEARKGPAEQGV